MAAIGRQERYRAKDWIGFLGIAAELRNVGIIGFGFILPPPIRALSSVG